MGVLIKITKHVAVIAVLCFLSVNCLVAQEFQPIIFSLANDPELKSNGMPVTLDFTVDSKGQVRIIEYGNFETSAYKGLEQAESVSESSIKDRAKKALTLYKKDTGGFFKQKLDSSFLQSELFNDKSHSLFLHSPEAKNLYPHQRLVSSSVLFNKNQMNELLSDIDKFPGNQLILKSALSARGEDIYITTKKNLPAFLAEKINELSYVPFVVQSHHPTNYKGIKSVGRASFSMFYDAKTKKVYLYPLLGYWKDFDANQETKTGLGSKINFSDKGGSKMTSAQKELFFKQLAPAVKDAFLRAASIRQNKLSGKHPLIAEIRDGFNARPAYEREAMRMATYKSDFKDSVHANILANSSSAEVFNSSFANISATVSKNMHNMKWSEVEFLGQALSHKSDFVQSEAWRYLATKGIRDKELLLALVNKNNMSAALNSESLKVQHGILSFLNNNQVGEAANITSKVVEQSLEARHLRRFLTSTDNSLVSKALELGLAINSKTPGIEKLSRVAFDSATLKKLLLNKNPYTSARAMQMTASMISHGQRKISLESLKVLNEPDVRNALAKHPSKSVHSVVLLLEDQQKIREEMRADNNKTINDKSKIKVSTVKLKLSKAKAAVIGVCKKIYRKFK